MENAAWLRKPLRILDFLFNARIEDMPMSAVVDEALRMSANVVHFHCMENMHGGFDEQGLYFRSRCSKREHRDVLAEYLPLARAADLRTVVYVNLHWYTRAFVDEHPDWTVLKADGSRVERLYGDDDSTFCLNSPWRAWSFRLLEDICRYPVDGIFFDGPIMFSGRGGCFCPSCRRKFAAGHGRELPAADPRRPEDFAAVRGFTVASMEDWYRDAMGVLRAARPGIVGYANCANVAEPDWTVGRSNRRLVPHLDALLAEGGFMYGRPADAGFFKTGASSRLYEVQAGGKPFINAVSMAYSPWRWVSMSASETRSLLAEASTGSSPYYAVFLQGAGMEGVRAAGEVYRFLAENRDCYEGTRSAATVALLQSGETLGLYKGVDIPWADLSYQGESRAEAVGNYSRAFYGWYELLLRARVPFDLIDEQALEEGRAAGYRVLVLPNAACLADGPCAAVERFVEAGGTLLADFETSHYDGEGRRRTDFGLARVFGASSRNAVSAHRRWDYAFPEEAMETLFRGTETDFLPAPRRNLEVTVTTGAAAAFLSVPIPSNIAASTLKSADPFLISNTLGGGRCFYFPAMVGEFYQEMHPGQYLPLVRNLVDSAGPLPVRVAGGPPVLDVRPRLQEDRGRLLLHLIGFTALAQSRGVPSRDVRVEVDLGRPARQVRALRLGRTLRFRQAGGTVSFRLPVLEEFELITVAWDLP